MVKACAETPIHVVAFNATKQAQQTKNMEKLLHIRANTELGRTCIPAALTQIIKATKTTEAEGLPYANAGKPMKTFLPTWVVAPSNLR